jgi:hypothetical protein
MSWLWWEFAAIGFNVETVNYKNIKFQVEDQAEEVNLRE